MFCIAAFIVLLLLSVISAKYRKLLKKSWGCVARRVTFRPCDTTFSEELKTTLLAPIALKRPKLLKPAEIFIQILSVVIVITTIWSLAYVAKAGTSLYVYGTCSPAKGDSCSLSAEACYADAGRIGFWESLVTLQVGRWISEEWEEDAELISAIPNRLKTWNPEDYKLTNATYAKPYDSSKPTALEIIDPGCLYCGKLMKNLVESNFADSYNLTYIAYPIKTEDGYKFPNSYAIATYLEAIRNNPLATADTPVDWQILERIYLEDNETGMLWQNYLNTADKATVESTLQQWLKEFGYSDEEVQLIVTEAASNETANALGASSATVKNEIQTIAIPTFMADGRRFDRVVKAEELTELAR